MSTMGEIYLLKRIEDLRIGKMKYFYLDQEDYEDWSDLLKENNILIVKKSNESKYRVYAHNERNQEIVQKIRRENQDFEEKINESEQSNDSLYYMFLIFMGLLAFGLLVLLL
ncbi:hypothetical protein [Enterococcus faecium]|uniref:hypothetical protein n=1 Tax=Enterococcus faecium TaxID=1352 RepID=UPI0008138AFA|nr:hypothetical protein [Enterococcus faecium]